MTLRTLFFLGLATGVTYYLWKRGVFSGEAHRVTF